MISFRALPGSSLVALLGAAALALMPSSALAAAGQHTALASFQQNVRADVLLEQFNGAAQNFNPYSVSGGGYAYTVQGAPLVHRDPNGIGAQLDSSPTIFNFTGRPVTAFAGTLRVFNENSAASVGGTVTILLSTGESFPVTVAPGGTFFGITSTQPFTGLQIDSPQHSPPSSAATYEWIDDVYVGTAVTAAAGGSGGADRCDDAPALTLVDATVFPFTTVGATAEVIPGVCDSAIDTGADVWYRFVATSDGVVTVNTCGCTFDSILRVFGSCLIAGSGVHLACNDDFCAGGGSSRGSQVSFRTVAGNDYLIRISGYNGASGSGNLTFSLVPDCTADFNHSGGKEVQDIFDFLSAWFGAC